jgi:hypothetical protein
MNLQRENQKHRCTDKKKHLNVERNHTKYQKEKEADMQTGERLAERSRQATACTYDYYIK